MTAGADKTSPADPALPRGAARRRRVLVVEDNSDLLMLFREAFEVEGFEVKTATNAPDARQAIALDGYDVAIIDITVPGGEDGFSLAARASATGLGVVLISGNIMLYDRLERSGHAFLKKPFNMPVLMKLAREVMQKTGAACAPDQ